MVKDERSGGGGHENDNNSKDKPQIFLSNNFYNYRSNKLHSRHHEHEQEASPSISPSGKHVDVSNRKHTTLWDHFISPLTDTSVKKDPNPRDSYLHMNQSVFTDVERSQALDKFSKIFMNKIGDAISSGKLSRAWRSGDSGGGSWLTTDYSKIGSFPDEIQLVDSKDYVAERNIIRPHLTPFVWGVTCSAITLFSLRFGKWYQSGNFINAALPKSSNIANEVRTKSMDPSAIQDLRTSTPHNYSTYSRPNPFNKHEQSSSTLESLATLPVDIALSMLIGISTSVFLTRPQMLLKDLSETPLLEGNMIVMDSLKPILYHSGRCGGMKIWGSSKV
eukprot:CCRYP_005669-RA/>CCRYP_005669-RA protein AED:0.28 eAED:0.28 QI:35/1/1/1/0/0/2/161/332